MRRDRRRGFRGYGPAGIVTPSFVPSDLATLRGWYKGDTGFVAGTSWADQSGVGNNVTLASGVTAGAALNGHQTASFDGTSNAYGYLAAFDLGAADHAFMAVVVKVTSAVAEHTIIGLDDGAFNVESVYTKSSSGNVTAYDFLGDVVVGGSVTGAWHRVAYAVNKAASSTLYVDNTSQGSATNNSNLANPSPLCIGFRAAVGIFMLGQIAEIVILNATPSAGDRTSLDTYFTTRYGI